MSIETRSQTKRKIQYQQDPNMVPMNIDYFQEKKGEFPHMFGPRGFETPPLIIPKNIPNIGGVVRHVTLEQLVESQQDANAIKLVDSLLVANHDQYFLLLTQ